LEQLRDLDRRSTRPTQHLPPSQPRRVAAFEQDVEVAFEIAIARGGPFVPYPAVQLDHQPDRR